LLLLLLLLLLCVSQVLQPNDIFPSLTAALSNPTFSTLGGVLQQISAGLNITLLEDLETSPGTLAAPLNEVRRQHTSSSNSSSSSSSSSVTCACQCWL
jgi:hypothetical protein